MNATTDESPDEPIALTENTASPAQADPDTLIIGREPRTPRTSGVSVKDIYV